MKLTKLKDLSLPTGVLSLAATADASRLYAACMDGFLYECDPAAGTVTPFAAKHASFASSCVLTPDGKTLISAGYDGWLLWHDVESKQCFRRLEAHSFWSWQLARTADGSQIATVTGQYLVGGEKYEPSQPSEPTVKVFDAHTGDLVRSFELLPPVLSVAFSPDGKHLAAANMMGDVQVWEIDTGNVAAQFNTPDFTSWGIIKSPHYCGGIYGLAFAPDGKSLLCCGMGPMNDPMAGNGKMTWQRWNWLKAERMSVIKDGERGSGLMETIAWQPDGTHFVMAGRQAQGNWNAALFSAADGGLVHSIDTKNRITQARFTADGKSLILSAANGQPQRKDGKWPSWGRVQVYRVEG